MVNWVLRSVMVQKGKRELEKKNRFQEFRLMLIEEVAFDKMLVSQRKTVFHNETR